MEYLKKVEFGQYKLKEIKWNIVHPYALGNPQYIQVTYLGELNHKDVPEGLGYITYINNHQRENVLSFRGVVHMKAGKIEGKSFFMAGDTQSCSIDGMVNGRPSGFGRAFFP